MKKSEPIAIVGLSCMFPDSQSVSEYWGNIKNKKDSIIEVRKTHWDPKELYNEDPKAPDMSYGKTGGFIPTYDFDPLANGMSPDVVESTDTSQILGVVVAQGAMIDAGYGVDRDFDRDRVSVMVGVCGTLEMVIPLGARLDHPKWRKSIKAAGVDDDPSDIGIRVYAYGGAVYVKSTGIAAKENKEVWIYDMFGRTVLQTSLHPSTLSRIPVDRVNAYLIVRTVSQSGVVIKKVYIK